MTLPVERTYSIANTREFLRNLQDPKKYPKVPMDVRREARRCLKHFPNEYDMREAQMSASRIFGKCSKREECVSCGFVLTDNKEGLCEHCMVSE
jgi:hypothetical protein